MSTTVAVGGLEVTSNHESAQDMVASLSPDKAESSQPRVLVDGGKAVPQESSEKVDEKANLSRAASELGKKGGAAAAAKRAEEAKAEPAKTEPEPKEEPEPEPAAAKAEDKDD